MQPWCTFQLIFTCFSVKWHLCLYTAELVKDFKCVMDVNKLNCSWIPANPSLNLTVNYRWEFQRRWMHCVFASFFRQNAFSIEFVRLWGHRVGTTGNAVARSCVHNGEAFAFQLDGLFQFDYECSHLSSTELKTMVVFNVRSVLGAPACLYVLIHPAHRNPLKSIRVNWTVERNWEMFIILNQSDHPSFMHPFRSLLDVISVLNVSHLTRKREFLWCIYVRSLVTMVTSMYCYGLSKVCNSCVTIISSLPYPPHLVKKDVRNRQRNARQGKNMR